MRKHEIENQVSEAESFVGTNEKCDDCGIRFGNPARENMVWIITVGDDRHGSRVLMFCNECHEEYYHSTDWDIVQPFEAQEWKNFDYPDGTWFTKEGWPRPLGWPNSECELCGSRKLMATLTYPYLHNNKMSWLCNPCWLKTLGYVKAAEDEEDMRGTFGFPPEGQSLGDEVFGEREGDIWTYPWTPDLYSPVYPIVPDDMAHKETAKLRKYLEHGVVGQTICLWQACRATAKTEPDEVCPNCNQTHPWWPTAGLTEALPSGTYGKVMGISEVNPNRAGVIGMWVKVTSGGTEKHPIGSRMWIHIKDYVPAHGITRGWEKGNYIAESWEAETSTNKPDAIDILNWVAAPKEIIKIAPPPPKEAEPMRCVKCNSNSITYSGGGFEGGQIEVECGDCDARYTECWEYVGYDILYEAEDYEIRRWIKVLRDEDPDDIEVDWDESNPVVPEEDWRVDWDAENFDEMSVSSHAYDRMGIRLSNTEKQIVENCARKWWKRAVINGWESLGVVALSLEAHRKTDAGGMTSNGDSVVAIVREGVMTTVMLRRLNQPMSRDALRVKKVKWCFRPPPSTAHQRGRRSRQYYAEDSYIKKKPNCRCGAELQWDAVRTAWYCIECPFNTYPDKRAESKLLPIGWEVLPTGQLQKTFNFDEQNAFIPIWNTVFQTDALSAILKQPTETIVSEDSLNIRLGDSRRNMRSNIQFADILNEFMEE
jgi:hypothetical protein